MTATRTNAVFAATVATIFSFAFVLINMPITALAGVGVAA